jgi:hypothetical protein
LHIAVDPLSSEVLASELTSSKKMDHEVFEDLIDQIPIKVERLFADLSL